MFFNRQKYLDKAIHAMNNGFVKIITGGRRVGKSFFLFNIFKPELIKRGVDERNIIALSFESLKDRERMKTPLDSFNYIRSKTQKEKKNYILLDEVQNLEGFIEIINSLRLEENMDVYVTGSNSKFLSKDIVTEFRGRDWQIPMFPLSFKELKQASMDTSLDVIWNNYCVYGGFPIIYEREAGKERREFLKKIFEEIYLKDIVNRYSIRSEDTLLTLAKVLASSIGSITNPLKLKNTFKSVERKDVSSDTLSNYLSYLEDSFLITKAERYDVQGKRYIGTKNKYYFEDLGIRNAVLDFRETSEEPHIMENMIFNELKSRGFDVKIGQVEFSQGSGIHQKKKELEIDFIVEKDGPKFYIQATLDASSKEKLILEKKSLMLVPDTFKKFIISKEVGLPFYDEEGIAHVNLFDFLLDESYLENDLLKKENKLNF